MSPRILFLPDSGAGVGGGHVMRSLTLARALASRGAHCRFVAGSEAQEVVRAFGEGIEAAAPCASDDLAALMDAAVACAGEWRADAIVVDHYRLEDPQLQALSQAGRLVMIHDLGDRALPADLIVDPTLGRTAADYAPLARDEAVVLAGAAYALVRPEFAALREQTLARRGLGGDVRRAQVSLGLTDVGGVTGRVLHNLGPHLGLIEVDIAVGKAAPSVRALIDQAWADRRLHVHVDARDMARLISIVDLAIGAGGSSAWERACLGLPSITLILADNQRQPALRLADAGATIALDVQADGFEDQLVAAWNGLVGDADHRRDLGAAAARLCDGKGAERVAEAVLQLVR